MPSYITTLLRWIGILLIRADVPLGNLLIGGCVLFWLFPELAAHPRNHDSSLKGPKVQITFQPTNPPAIENSYFTNSALFTIGISIRVGLLVWGVLSKYHLVPQISKRKPKLIEISRMVRDGLGRIIEPTCKILRRFGMGLKSAVKYLWATDSDVAELQCKLAASDERLAQVERQLMQSSSSNGNLTKDITELTCKLDARDGRLAQVELQLLESSGKNEQLANDVVELACNLAERDEKLARLEPQFLTTSSKNRQLRREVVELKSKLVEFEEIESELAQRDELIRSHEERNETVRVVGQTVLDRLMEPSG
jgi:hypothetical protein